MTLTDGVKVDTRPYYVPVSDEERVFKAAYRQGLSIVLKGPTGCGKTRFVEAMAHDLGRPLITVACHDGPPTRGLVGRDLLRGRHLLSRRGGGSSPGHHRCAAPARGLPTSAADRTTRRHIGRGTRLRPCGVLQPRLPKRAEGPQGL